MAGTAPNRVLVFSPSGDPSLAPAQAVARWTARRLEAEGHEVDLCADAEAERPAIDALPSHHGLAAFAHGDEWSIFGHSGKPALDRDNVAALHGLWIWAFACRTRVELGPQAIHAGARAWAGFEVAVMVDWEPEAVPALVRADLAAMTSEPAARFAAGCFDPDSLRRRIRELGERVLAELDDVDAHPDAVGLQLSVQQMIDKLHVLLPQSV